LVLLTVGAVVFAVVPPSSVDPTHRLQFNALAYTLDLLVPVVNLGQESAWAPVGATQWVAYGLVAAGWILVSVIAAGLTRALSRN